MESTDKFRYFIGKVCTVFTTPVNRIPQESNTDYLKHVFNYFVGRVESIDKDGIILVHVNNGQKSFWSFNNLVGLAEEKELDPKKDAEIIKKMMQQPAQPAKPIQNNSPFVDAIKMAELAKQLTAINTN